MLFRSRGKAFFEPLIEYMLSGPIVATVWEGRGVVSGGLLLAAANSPYTLTDQLVIEADGELYVEPGVLVRVAPDASVHIRGKAWFWGEDEGIRFEPTQDKAVKRYLVLDSE